MLGPEKVRAEQHDFQLEEMYYKEILTYMSIRAVQNGELEPEI